MSFDELIEEWRIEASTASTTFHGRLLDILLEVPEVEKSVSTFRPINYQSAFSERSLSSGSLPSLDFDGVDSECSTSGPPSPDLEYLIDTNQQSNRRKRRQSSSSFVWTDNHPLASNHNVYALSETLKHRVDEVHETKTALNVFPSKRSWTRQAFLSLLHLDIPKNKTLVTSKTTYTKNNLDHTRIQPNGAREEVKNLQIKACQALHKISQPLTDKNRFDKLINEYEEIPLSRLDRHIEHKEEKPSTFQPSDMFCPLQRPPRAPTVQREIRANSAFLRIIVLEMNMRRAGKFNPAIKSRAQIVLAPRRDQIPNASVYTLGRSRGHVSSRWIGICIDDE